jgi:hypothetical protein
MVLSLLIDENSRLLLERKAHIIEASIHRNYTTILNIIIFGELTVWSRSEPRYWRSDHRRD